jgi:hypothetical protein
MPVARVFDPYTGGAIGGGGGTPVPTGFVNVGDLTPLTFSDPASLLTSYAFNAGDHEFTMTTQLANGDYALNSGGNFTGPRWSGPLVDGTGAPVLAGDKFLMMVQLTDLDPGASRQWAAAWGVAKVPASTLTAAIQPNVIWGGSTGVGTPNGGVGILNFASTASIASATLVSGNLQFAGSPQRLMVGGSVEISSPTTTGVASRTGGTAFAGAAGDPLQFFVAVTSLGAVATTAGLLKMKARYQIVRFV